MKNEKELAELIACHLPISIRIAENFIQSAIKGYTFGNMDYPMALASKDKMIDECVDMLNEFINLQDPTTMCGEDIDQFRDLQNRVRNLIK